MPSSRPIPRRRLIIRPSRPASAANTRSLHPRGYVRIASVAPAPVLTQLCPTAKAAARLCHYPIPSPAQRPLKFVEFRLQLRLRLRPLAPICVAPLATVSRSRLDSNTALALFPFRARRRAPPPRPNQRRSISVGSATDSAARLSHEAPESKSGVPNLHRIPLQLLRTARPLRARCSQVRWLPPARALSGPAVHRRSPPIRPRAGPG